MTLIDWDKKELLSSDKMNKMTVRRGTNADQKSVPDHERSEGDPWFNTQRNAYQIYLRGSGNTFIVSEITNQIFRQEAKIGVGGTKKTIVDERFINSLGKMNSVVLFSCEYSKRSDAGVIEVIVTDGSSPVSKETNFAGSSVDNKTIVESILLTENFDIDAELNFRVEVKNIDIKNIEFRGA